MSSKFMICRVDPRTEQIRFFSKGEEMWLPALSNGSKKFSGDRAAVEREFALIEKESGLTYDIIELTQND
jgi:hypothetical protein